MDRKQISEKQKPESILVKDDRFLEQARKLAERLNVTLVRDQDSFFPEQVFLKLDQEGLAIQQKDQVLRGDFTGMKQRLRVSNLQREMLVKAVRIKGMTSPLVLDATAGMGEDSLILAAAGCRVRMYERDPVIAALLEDALRRASGIPELSEILKRMEFHQEDSIVSMRSLTEKPDVILLDPMFPERQKSAQVKKKFQLLHHLEEPCQDEEALLQAAVDASPRKIVIKRPLKGGFLAGRKPDYSLRGKAIRYDCLVFAQI